MINSEPLFLRNPDSLGPTPQENRPQFLIVDSSQEDYLELFTECERKQATHTLCPTANAALRLSRTETPLCYMVNIQLTDLSGFELFEMLLAMWPQACGIMVADIYTAADEVKARSVGASMYFSKPLRFEVFDAIATKGKLYSRPVKGEQHTAL